MGTWLGGPTRSCRWTHEATAWPDGRPQQHQVATRRGELEEQRSCAYGHVAAVATGTGHCGGHSCCCCWATPTPPHAAGNQGSPGCAAAAGWPVGAVRGCMGLCERHVRQRAAPPPDSAAMRPTSSQACAVGYGTNGSVSLGLCLRRHATPAHALQQVQRTFALKAAMPAPPGPTHGQLVDRPNAAPTRRGRRSRAAFLVPGGAVVESPTLSHLQAFCALPTARRLHGCWYATNGGHPGSATAGSVCPPRVVLP